MATVSSRHLLLQQREFISPKLQLSSHLLLTHGLQTSKTNNNNNNNNNNNRLLQFSRPAVPPAKNNNTPAPRDDDDEEGVSLGTMKLPINTDLDRFETLLFQWANSMNQGAQIPLPMPLKVDKVKGGVRLGFITIGDGVTEVPVYIDCLVFPAAGGSPPVFRAIRDGPMKDRSPPGEPRIMKSLLAALKKSVELAAI